MDFSTELNGRTEFRLNRVKTSKVFSAKFSGNPFVTLCAHIPHPAGGRYQDSAVSLFFSENVIVLRKRTLRLWLMDVMQCAYCVI